MEFTEAIHNVLSLIPQIEELKSEQQECLRHFIEGNDVLALLPTEAHNIRNDQAVAIGRS